MGAEENKDVVRRWVEVTNAQNLDDLDELFTGDTYDHVGQRTGVAWWKEVFGFLYATLPDWRWTLEDIVAEQDRVVARLTVHGTHKGSVIPFLRGIPPTGKSVVWTHHHTFRFVNGKIAEHWANRDDSASSGRSKGRWRCPGRRPQAHVRCRGAGHVRR